MSELNRIRRYSLECLRLEADCMQLACDLRRRDWQAHFLRMAKEWRRLADRGPCALAVVAPAACLLPPPANVGTN
jgi:hypothetical protein